MFTEEINELFSYDVRKVDKYFKRLEVKSMDIINYPAIIRLDGVNFSKYLSNFNSPRDIRVHKALIYGAEKLIRTFNAICGYITSDEVNILLSRYIPYSSRHEKIISISSGILSSAVSIKLGIPLYFDARIIEITNINDIKAYFLYRMKIGFNNYISKVYHNIFPSSKTPDLKYMLHKLASKNINLSSIPTWEYLGSCLVWEEYIKNGYNPITKRSVKSKRRKLVVYDGRYCIKYFGIFSKFLCT